MNVADSSSSVGADSSAAADARPFWARAAGPILGAIGMALGAPSLAYPFGRDQGLYNYIAREWVHHGAMPYRDVFDQKTPGIYLIHALLISVLGEGMWQIRLAEWLAMIPLGLAVASLGTPSGKKTPSWLLGCGVLIANIEYFGFFDFWDTAQCEVWCSVGVIVAAWLVLRSRLGRVSGAFLAGLACAFAFVMKPPCGAMIAVVAVALGIVARREGKLVPAVAAFAGGFTLLTGGVLAIFAAGGAMPDLVDVLVGLNRAYVKNDRGVTDAGDVLTRVGDGHHAYDPIATITHVVLFLGVLRCGFVRGENGRWRYLLPIALIAAAAIGTVSQLKFYIYHWALLLAGETLALTTIAHDVQRICRAKRAWIAPVSLGLATLLLFVASFGSFRRWFERTAGTIRFVTGRIDREAFTDQFRVVPLNYYYHDSEKIAVWVREHSKPEDTLLVRGFEPEIYVVSQRSYGGRFFWDDFLVAPRRAYRREEWLAQDRADFERIKPRWIVAYRDRPDMFGWPEPAPLRSATSYEPLGYKRVHEQYGFVVLERVVD